MIAPGKIPVDSPLALCGVVLLLAFAVRPYTTQATPISVDGATVTLNFQDGNDTNRLSEAAGWSTSDTDNRPDGYVDDSNNTNNLLGFLGGVYDAPSSLSTELTYNFEAGSSNRFVFQWTQNISSSSFPGDDIFGWRFLSGADTTAFSVKFLNDTGPTNDRDLLVQGYDGAGIALTLATGQPNDWFIDRDDANDFRVTADLATKKWALDVFNKSNSSWFGLVIDASIDPSVTSLNKFAATWTVTATNAAEAGDNIMAFDNITIQGKQTVTISLNIPTNSVYNGSPQTVSPTTVPTGVALIVKYNGSTNVPVNAGAYTVAAEVEDTNTYYSAPTSGSWNIAKATQTITGVAATVTKTVGDASYPVGGTVVSGLPLSYSSSTPGVATVDATSGAVTIVAPGSTTITVSQGGNSNYEAATSVTQVLTVNAATTPAEDYLASFGLTGANAALSADPDGDGLTNAAEFAFGTDPTASTASPVTVTSPAGTVKITFLGRTTGVTYVVKTSTNLSAISAGFSGTDGPTAVSPQPSGLPSGYTQYEASVNTTSGERNFLKVVATLP